MIFQPQTSELALYIDETGSPKPNRKDQALYFAMGGVLLERAHEVLVATSISEFKQRWGIAESTPLHGSEIRSKKKNFAWLGKLSEADQVRFMDDLSTTIVGLPIVVHACVVSRPGYLNRYLELYGSQTWEMMKSAFTILIERSVKFSQRYNASLTVYYEKAGKTEDRLLQGYFGEVRSTGHPFSPTNAATYNPLEPSDLQKSLRGIERKTKQNPVLQVADLCLYPVCRGKDDPANRAYQLLRERNILVDTQIAPGDVGSQGIKYYCFDETKF
jgi:hypothetical protein